MQFTKYTTTMFDAVQRLVLMSKTTSNPRATMKIKLLFSIS